MRKLTIINISDELTKKLSFFQTLSSLIRDLILYVVVLLTVAILYFGGKPSSLNALDWSKLVGSAFLVVIGPILTFFVFKFVFRLIQEFLDFPRGLFIPGSRVPRGFYAWAIMKSNRLTKRQYISRVRKFQRISQILAKNHPKSYGLILKILDYYGVFYSFQNRTNPYLLAILALVFAGLVFKRIMDAYIP